MPFKEPQQVDRYIDEHEGRTDHKDELSDNDSATFAAGHEAVRLKSGMILHRLCSKQMPMGAFWIDDPTFIHMIHQIQLHSPHISEQAKRNTVRNELSLLTRWGNQLTHRIKITLEREFVAYKGAVGRQSDWVLTDSKPRKKFVPHGTGVSRNAEYRFGGVTQYVIPAMRSIHLTESPDPGFSVNVNMVHLFRPGY